MFPLFLYSNLRYDGWLRRNGVLIALEHWPEMAETWQHGIDEQLNATLRDELQLSFVPLAPKEWECIALASKDNAKEEIARKLEVGTQTINTHLSRAITKVKEALAYQTDDESEIARIKGLRIPLHRLVYIALDCSMIPVGDEMEPAMLTPEEAIFLKALAKGETQQGAASWAGVNSVTTLKKRLLPGISAVLEAQTTPGMIGNAYRMKLFVPCPSPQLPESESDGKGKFE